MPKDLDNILMGTVAELLYCAYLVSKYDFRTRASERTDELSGKNLTIKSKAIGSTLLSCLSYIYQVNAVEKGETPYEPLHILRNQLVLHGQCCFPRLVLPNNHRYPSRCQ
jgi:hypothetical protein